MAPTRCNALVGRVSRFPGENMATSPQRTSAAKRVLQALGAALLLAATYKAAVLLVALPRYYRAPTFWLEAGTNLVLWVPCVAGGLVLLRGRPSGFYPLYALAALLLLGWTVLLCPYLYRVLGRPPVWVACLNLPVGVAALALVVLAHRHSLQFVPAEPAGGHGLWLYPLCLLVGISTLYAACCYGRQRAECEAGEVVWRGEVAKANSRAEDAAADWALVISRYPYTSAWGKAVYLIGIYERDRGRRDEALARFRSLLGSGLDDPDPSGYLMDVFQEYRQEACLEIASYYEALGDYPTALRFVVRARDTFHLGVGCGTCQMEIILAIDERIQRLEQLAKGAR
jgi:hypothetical protein